MFRNLRHLIPRASSTAIRISASFPARVLSVSQKPYQKSNNMQTQSRLSSSTTSTSDEKEIKTSSSKTPTSDTIDDYLPPLNLKDLSENSKSLITQICFFENNLSTKSKYYFDLRAMSDEKLEGEKNKLKKENKFNFSLYRRVTIYRNFYRHENERKIKLLSEEVERRESLKKISSNDLLIEINRLNTDVKSLENEIGISRNKSLGLTSFILQGNLILTPVDKRVEKINEVLNLQAHIDAYIEQMRITLDILNTDKTIIETEITKRKNQPRPKL
ncbi:hypothetical protein AYO45_04135 [Gammaproteobacteria bacterium SCGC AG-212-F23]|nr:hypothetical protein AYO45_04135 [Gammaproteobacteria bacterium SCGC AG-212-F23]